VTPRGRRPELPDGPTARERILSAAEELFAEHGYDRTSTARLARAAGVPQGLIFYHFGTKQDLLLSLLRERAGSTLAELAPNTPPGDVSAAVAELWRRLRDHLGTPSPMQRIMLRDIDAHPDLRRHAQQFLDDAIDQVAGHLADATGTGHPPTPEQLTAARLLTVTAALSDLTHGDSGADLDPDVVARLLTRGLG
jgi:AcrR family transcriptional regulator